MRRGDRGRVKLRIRASPDSSLSSSSVGSCSRLVDSEGEVTVIGRKTNCGPTDIDTESAHGSLAPSEAVSALKVKRALLLLRKPLQQRVVRVRCSVMNRIVKALRRKGWRVKKLWQPK